MSWKEKFSRNFKVGDRVEFINEINWYNIDKGRPQGHSRIKGESTIIKSIDIEKGMFIMACDDTAWHYLKDIRRCKQ